MLTAEIVKAKARELGADGVGIADAAVLNAYPPDPAHPQIPARISPEIRSCVAFFKRIPAGAFRARDNACIHHVDQLLLREMDRVGYRIARFLEANGHWAFQTAAQETVWEMKTASYGSLSTRHVAIEAGLGTIGLELNLLRREPGRRCSRVVRHLAGAPARRRRLRGLPPLPRRLPRRRRLQPVPQGRPARDPGEDRREGRASARAARDQEAGRADPRHGRRPRALDWRGPLSPARPARRDSRMSQRAAAATSSPGRRSC